MQFSLKEVTSNKDLKKFIQFPHILYKNNKQYVPQIDSQEKVLLTKNPSLEYCTLKLWIAEDQDGRVVGRIGAIHNPRANKEHNYSRIRFGWFDFVEEFEVAQLLMNRAIEWSKSLGMNEIHGPLGYNTWNRQGTMIEGFENTPPVNCIYNYEYYPSFMDMLGFNKEVDWIQLKINATQKVPEKIVKIHDMLLERYNLKYLDFKKVTKERRDKIIDSFFKEYNETFRSVDNFIPLTNSEIKSISDNYFPMLKPELTSFILDEDDNVAAFSVCFPSMSEAFKKAKGKLFPFGWFHLLKAFRKYNTIDFMMSGASPKWQSKGLSSMYHVYMERSLAGRDVRWGITNPQAETNSAYKVWERYESQPYMRRRCYIKTI